MPCQQEANLYILQCWNCMAVGMTYGPFSSRLTNICHAGGPSKYCKSEDRHAQKPKLKPKQAKKVYLKGASQLLLQLLLSLLLPSQDTGHSPFEGHRLALLIGKMHGNGVDHVVHMRAAALADQHGQNALQIGPHLLAHLCCYDGILLTALCCALHTHTETHSSATMHS